MLVLCQRVSALGKLLGYSYNAESLSTALQTLSASDSLDFRALLLPDGTLADSGTDEPFYTVTSADSGNTLEFTLLVE